MRSPTLWLPTLLLQWLIGLWQHAYNTSGPCSAGFECDSRLGHRFFLRACMHACWYAMVPLCSLACLGARIQSVALCPMVATKLCGCTCAQASVQLLQYATTLLTCVYGKLHRHYPLEVCVCHIVIMQSCVSTLLNVLQWHL